MRMKPISKLQWKINGRYNDFHILSYSFSFHDWILCTFQRSIGHQIVVLQSFWKKKFVLEEDFGDHMEYLDLDVKFLLFYRWNFWGFLISGMVR